MDSSIHFTQTFFLLNHFTCITKGMLKNFGLNLNDVFSVFDVRTKDVKGNLNSQCLIPLLTTSRIVRIRKTLLMLLSGLECM